MAEGCEVCCVASRRLDRSQAFAAEFGIPRATDDYRSLQPSEVEAVLIEVPHSTQDEVSVYALQAGLHTLIGGCLATNVATGTEIVRLARERGLIVETGYESRYQDMWRLARKYVNEGSIGQPVAVNSAALFHASSDSWYYNEKRSGGMPITHMTYGYLNPIRWIFGSPVQVSAFSNRKSQTDAEHVRHETCTANLLLPNNVLCNLLAGYVKPMALNVWNVKVLGTEGYLEIDPGIGKPDSVTLHRRDHPVLIQDCIGESAFHRQARSFISAIRGANECLNPAPDSLIDVQIAELIARSAETGTTLSVEPLPPI